MLEKDMRTGLVGVPRPNSRLSVRDFLEWSHNYWEDAARNYGDWIVVARKFRQLHRDEFKDPNSEAWKIFFSEEAKLDRPLDRKFSEIMRQTKGHVLVLDLGCGTGLWAKNHIKDILRQGQYFAIEDSESARLLAQERLKEMGLGHERNRIIAGNVMDLISIASGFLPIGSHYVIALVKRLALHICPDQKWKKFWRSVSQIAECVLYCETVKDELEKDRPENRGTKYRWFYKETVPTLLHTPQSMRLEGPVFKAKQHGDTHYIAKFVHVVDGRWQ